MTTKERCVEKKEDRARSGDLIDVFSIGGIQLNDFLTADDEASDVDPAPYPLTLAYAPKSGLVQLRHTVDPELMFRTYWYNSGTNEAMKEHLGEVALKASQVASLKPGDIVVDIGCNDGTLLQGYPNWVTKIGYDPSKIEPKGVDIFINDFFAISDGITKGWAGHAKIVTSIAMFYDVDDPVAFASSVRQIMRDDGVWLIEMHYLRTMLERNEVDAICHEHLCYYSLTSLQYVLSQANLTVVDVEFNETNGGSMLAYVRKTGRATAPTPEMLNALARERHAPLIDQLIDFGKRVEFNKIALGQMLQDAKEDGKLVIGYGASTKGNTILQYAGIGRYLLPAIADRNPEKWGRFTPGTYIPIISEEEMRKLKPDYLLALPYHFMDMFAKREPWANWIVPIPQPHFQVRS